MSSNDPFEILNLKRKGATLAAIKKAYSAKLKVTRPDDDPQGFMALREAYESARNIIRWDEPDPSEELSTSDDTATESTELSSEIGGNDEDSGEDKNEITSWWDEKLAYQLNSSPSGQLIERTLRWIREQDCPNPQQFFASIAKEPALQATRYYNEYCHFVLSRIYFDAGGDDDIYYTEIDPDEEIDYDHPKWLREDVIIAIEDFCNFLSHTPEQEWEAIQLNCVKALFKDTFAKEASKKELLEPLDLIEIRAKNFEQNNQDQYGSYFDKDKRKWIDKSPVGQAILDIEQLAETYNPETLLDDWAEIVERDNIQAIDEFQEFDDRLRAFICEKTGINDGSAYPKWVGWLPNNVFEYLDEVFGWRQQNQVNNWSRYQYEWLQKILPKTRGNEILSDNYSSSNQEQVEWTKSFFKRLLTLPSAWSIFIIYLLYRVIQVVYRLS